MGRKLVVFVSFLNVYSNSPSTLAGRFVNIAADKADGVQGGGVRGGGVRGGGGGVRDGGVGGENEREREENRDRAKRRECFLWGVRAEG